MNDFIEEFIDFINFRNRRPSFPKVYPDGRIWIYEVRFLIFARRSRWRYVKGCGWFYVK